MAGLNKVEQYLIDLGIGYEEIGPNTWVVDDDERSLMRVVVSYNEPVVLIRAALMDVPTQKKLELYETLLSYNASELLHGAYAIEKGKVIITDSLEYALMDKIEFEASLDAIGFALSQHYPKLSQYK